MKRSLFVAMLILALAGLWGSGCAGTTRSVKSAEAPARKPSPADGAEEVRALRDPELEERVKAYAHFAAGISLDMNDEPEAALEHYLRSASADPANEPLVLDTARRLIQHREFTRAIELLERAAQQPGASGRIIAGLASAYTEAGRDEQAIKANEEALKRDPHLLQAYRHLSQIHLEKRRPAEAVKVLDRAASQSATDPGFWVDLAELYATHSRLNPDEAESTKAKIIRALDRAAELKPQNLLVIQKLADGFKLMGEYSRAEPFYLELLDRIPALPGLREKLAEIYLREGKKEKATGQLESIVRSNPRNEQAYFFLGSIAMEAKKFAEAEEFFGKALLLKPEFEPVYYDLANLKLALNKPSEALEVLGRARARFKQSFLMEFYTGQAHAHAKDYEAAVKHFTQAEIVARASEPERLNQITFYQVFCFQFGAALERKGDHAEAVKYFRKCLEKSPKFADAMNYLGYMWADRGENLEEARALIEQAVELEPKNAAFLDSLGWVLFRLKQPREALEWLQKAIENAEEPDPTLFDHLGDVYQELGEPDKAQESWRKAVAIEPNDQIQKKILSAPAGTTRTE